MNATHCPRCGKQLAPDAPSGICVSCLLQAGLDSEQPTVPPKPAGYYSVDAAATSPAKLAGLFPKLELVELLGQGGMGAVYRARQIKLDRDVALKIIRPDSRETAGFAERFEREAKALARLNHPNIISVYDYGSVKTGNGDNEIYYLLMEFADGVNLRQLINSKSISPEQALNIVPQICEALQFAHDAGVVHRDIKPENILLDKQGRVKIADFGLAKVISDDASAFNLTGSHQVMGTPRYMAPEQLEQTRTVDHRADIYSLGVVFYEMLTGELPMGQFELPSKKINVDVRMDEVVLRALAKEPERRYQLASDLKTDVNAISSGDLLATRPNSDVSTSVVRVANWLGLCGWLSIPGMILLSAIMVGYVALSPREGLNFSVWIQIFSLPVLVQLVTLPIWLMGASRMRGLLSRPLAITASVIAMLPLNPICLIGIPVGIWSLVTLMRLDVQRAFAVQTVSVEKTRQQIRLAASLLWYEGCLKLVLVVCLSVQPLLSMLSYATGAGNGGPGKTILLQIVLLVVVWVSLISTQIFGARQLLDFRSYGWGIRSAILAVLTGWVVSLPIAIYAFAVLFQRTRGQDSTRGLFEGSVNSKQMTFDRGDYALSSRSGRHLVDLERPDPQRLINPSKALFALGLAMIVVSITVIGWSEFQLARVNAVNQQGNAKSNDSGSDGASVGGASSNSTSDTTAARGGVSEASQNSGSSHSSRTISASPHPWSGSTDTLWFQKIVQLPSIILGGFFLLVAVFSLEQQNFGFCRLGGWLTLLPVYVLWPVGLLVGIVFLLAMSRFDASTWHPTPSKNKLDSTPIFKNWTNATSVGALISAALAATTFLPWIGISLFSMVIISGHGVERWEGFAILVLAVAGFLAIVLGDLLRLSRSWRLGVPLVIGLVSAGLAVYMISISLETATHNATGDFSQLGEMIASNFRGTPRAGLFVTLGLALTLSLWIAYRYWTENSRRERDLSPATFQD